MLYSKCILCYTARLNLVLPLITGCNKGMPNRLTRRNDQAVRIDPSLVPEADEAIRQITLQRGNITMFRPFGNDPLEMHRELYQK